VDAPQKRVYILEDEPAIAAIEADILRDMGYSAVVCNRIVELGDLIDMGLPDLLVVDVMLPDGDGGDVTTLLRDMWPGIPVVFVSATSRERLNELRDLGPVVAKPFDIDDFSTAVRRALEEPNGARSADA
jgi:DNA-binding response OmpR family regulator